MNNPAENVKANRLHKRKETKMRTVKINTTARINGEADETNIRATIRVQWYATGDGGGEWCAQSKIEPARANEDESIVLAIENEAINIAKENRI